MVAQLRMPSTILYGSESFKQIGQQVSELGKKALVISDNVMSDLGHVQLCKSYLQDHSVEVVSYIEVNTEPKDKHVDECLDILRQENCDVIVSLGGGSCLDAAKAVSVMANSTGHINDYYQGNKAFSKNVVPHIAVPTTAGTGSEVTSVTVITNTRAQIKMMMKDPVFMPKVAIVDPILSMTSPRHVTAATGIDALCHAIEAYISSESHHMTDVLALSAIELISKHIKTCYEAGDDLTAREKMSTAAMQAGMAFSNASVCLVHGMSRPIGALFNVPHGVSNAMLLPAVLEFSYKHCQERLAILGRIFTEELHSATELEAAKGAVEHIKQLCFALNIPNMKTWGIGEQEFQASVEKMAKDALDSGSPQKNPIIPTHEEIIRLYERCYDYNFQ